MRSALRERSIVFNSILLPIVLYPLILWAAFTGIVFVQGQTEGFTSRVLVTDWPKGHPGLRRTFERDTHLQLLQNTNNLDEAESRIRDGRLDVLLAFVPVGERNEAGPPNFEARLTYNQSRERSAAAERRVRGLVDEYRQTWLKREATALGVSPAEWQRFTIAMRNVASGKQVGAFLLGMLLPVLFVVMVAMGCFFPAVDATAGERERQSWETLMSTAASRVSILTSKYLYVATMGGVAGVLNLLAMAATVKPIFAPLLAKGGQGVEFSVPLTAVPLLLVAALLLAGFVAAGMMLFASFARTFKEGQAMITPFYLIVLLPMMFLQVPGLTFSVPLALVPVVNVTMMVRAAVSGSFPILPILVAMLVSVAVIAACIRLAVYILQFEDVMLGSYNGSLVRFLRERVRKPRRNSACPTTMA
jgi:ABC-type Na+ efflux pump permease subunit